MMSVAALEKEMQADEGPLRARRLNPLVVRPVDVPEGCLGADSRPPLERRAH